MNLSLVTIGRATRKQASADDLIATYIERIGHFARCEAMNYPHEQKFLDALGQSQGEKKPRKTEGGPQGRFSSSRTEKSPSKRMPLLLTLLDSRGRSFSTEQFAEWLRRQRDQSVRHLVFAIGPPDGWSDSARSRADLLLSLGPMTLPHELAAVVLGEQIYRAFTIIQGHPYHLGHK